jgi:hypothetical protein
MTAVDLSAESSVSNAGKGVLTTAPGSNDLAHAVALSDAIKGMPAAPISPEIPLKTVLELGQIMVKSTNCWIF